MSRFQKSRSSWSWYSQKLWYQIQEWAEFGFGWLIYTLFITLHKCLTICTGVAALTTVCVVTVGAFQTNLTGQEFLSSILLIIFALALAFLYARLYRGKSELEQSQIEVEILVALLWSIPVKSFELLLFGSMGFGIGRLIRLVLLAFSSSETSSRLPQMLPTIGWPAIGLLIGLPLGFLAILVRFHLKQSSETFWQLVRSVRKQPTKWANLFTNLTMYAALLAGIFL